MPFSRIPDETGEIPRQTPDSCGAPFSVRGHGKADVTRLRDVDVAEFACKRGAIVEPAVERNGHVGMLRQQFAVFRTARLLHGGSTNRNHVEVASGGAPMTATQL
jgi:hypothetical protein